MNYDSIPSRILTDRILDLVLLPLAFHLPQLSIFRVYL